MKELKQAYLKDCIFKLARIEGDSAKPYVYMDTHHIAGTHGYETKAHKFTLFLPVRGSKGGPKVRCIRTVQDLRELGLEPKLDTKILVQLKDNSGICFNGEMTGYGIETVNGVQIVKELHFGGDKYDTTELLKFQFRVLYYDAMKCGKYWSEWEDFKIDAQCAQDTQNNENK